MANYLRLKKGEERRILQGHPWIFSNEIDVTATPLKSFSPGEQVSVLSHAKKPLGSCYVNPQSLICARIFSREADAQLDEALIHQRLQQAYAARCVLFSQPFYRLVYSEGDNLPGLIIDRFGRHFVVQTNTAGMEKVLPAIVAALQKLFPELISIYLQNDSPMRAYEGLETYHRSAFGNAPECLELKENDTLFTAPLSLGQKTGWFYDHRMNRSRLPTYASGKKILDVFSYVGGWGIQAAICGAKEVTCIDSSKQAGEFVLRNAALNNVSDKLKFIQDDAFDALKALKARGESFDLIVLDPPAFIKKAKDHKQGLIAYQRINEAAFKLLNAGGILISCSCSMHLAIDDLLQLIRRAAYNTQTDIQVLERGHQGPDHPLHAAIPEMDYLKTWFIRKV